MTIKHLYFTNLDCLTKYFRLKNYFAIFSELDTIEKLNLSLPSHPAETFCDHKYY